MNLKILLFPLAAACLMLGLHFAVFKSFINFFQIESFRLRILLYAAMIILSFSFITAFLLLQWRENAWTVSCYWFAAAWTGFLIHCLTAIIAAWILLGAARLAGISLSTKAIGTAVIVISMAVTVYGVWASFHPVVRTVEAEVKHLPGYWKNRTIVHLSDLHLGHIYKKSFARRVSDTVNSLDPDLVLITGDLLDGMGGPYLDNVKPLCFLESKHGIFFVTGNHEHYAGIEKSLEIIKKTPLQILDNEALNLKGLEIVGVSYPGIKGLDEIKGLSNSENPDMLRIAMFHTPTEMGRNTGGMGEQHFANYWMPDTSYDLNKKLNADLQISGHTHHGQLFPVNLLTRLLYKGYDYGLKEINGNYIYISAGTGSWGPPMRTSGRPEIVVINLVKK